MTFELLNKLIEENNIPKDVQLLSDSGWECSETEMDGIYYNRKENKMIFTQNGNYYDHWFKLDDWELIYGWNKQCHDRQHRIDDDCAVLMDPCHGRSLCIGIQRIDHCSYYRKGVRDGL